jgi:hypothetical protein
VYPDAGEAALSIKTNFKDSTAAANGKKALPFRVTSIKEAIKESSSALKGNDRSANGSGNSSSASAGGGCELQLVVNPGFDVSEWIQVRVQRFLKPFISQHSCMYITYYLCMLSSTV